MVNHELITLLTDEELDIDTALRGGCDRVEQRIIRHKVRAGDREPTLRGVDQRVEQSKVVLIRETRSAGNHLAHHIAWFHLVWVRAHVASQLMM